MAAADQPHDRGEVDDRAARGQHVAADRAGAEEAAVEVDRVHLAPALALGSSTVAMRPPIPALLTRTSIRPWRWIKLPTYRFDADLVGDVGQCAAAISSAAARRAFDVAHGDVRARLGERMGGHPTDAGAAAMTSATRPSICSSPR